MIYEKPHLTLIELQGPFAPGQCCILKAEYKKCTLKCALQCHRVKRERQRGLSFTAQPPLQNSCWSNRPEMH